MSLTIDHVAFAGRDLDALREAADAVGLSTEYGGVHGTGTTHMAIAGLPDGSYLELVAPTPGTDPADAGFWPTHLARDAGPAGWCIEVADVGTAAKRAIDAGVAVDGPHTASRERTDGRLVEWDMCFEGTDERLPFTIRDRTPRPYRVTPTPELEAGPLTGFDTVVLAVEDVTETADLLTRRHRFPSPVEGDGPDALPRVERFPGQPAALAPATGALTERVASVGEGPCASLLSVEDLGAARETFALTEDEPWGDRRMAWFDHERFHGRLGVVG